MPVEPMIYGGLFLAAFLAATLLPMQSEAALVALLLADYPPWLLVAVASAGNVLGSTVNWWLGRGLLRFQDRRWFPVSPAALERAGRRYRRYGRWSLLLSWVPVIGDPLTLVAGVMREPLRVFLPLVALAKTGRYLVLAWVTLRYMALP
jgi:membrane protein YqaA with SNARE-associated domain